ncbi:MAG: hypothetical protein LBD77_01205 [Bifidobacteriaceae bacterium]|nr:hypothetical protein [Bifidobacteriaceae bacterium]
MVETREVLRVWLSGEGLRTVADLAPDLMPEHLGGTFARHLASAHRRLGVQPRRGAQLVDLGAEPGARHRAQRVKPQATRYTTLRDATA